MKKKNQKQAQYVLDTTMHKLCACYYYNPERVIHRIGNGDLSQDTW